MWGSARHTRNYLRVRGEYRRSSARSVTRLELPPRARRIPLYYGVPEDEMGTTSACAENTAHPVFPAPPARNYLRVRGEYCTIIAVALSNPELPPRTRRILHFIVPKPHGNGTTSAYAENTRRLRSRPRVGWNYLRVRGEYRSTKSWVVHHEELPPRTRRIRLIE